MSGRDGKARHTEENHAEGLEEAGGSLGWDCRHLRRAVAREEEEVKSAKWVMSEFKGP